MILDWSILDKEIVYEQLYKYNFYISSRSRKRSISGTFSVL